MQKIPHPHLSWRIVNKLRSFSSTLHTIWLAPRVFRTADIHLLLQSPEQKLAQQSLDLQKPIDRAQRVLIVVPFRDKWPLTEKCLQSLAAQSRGPHQFLLVLVDNGSVEENTKLGIQDCLLKSTDKFRYRHLCYDQPFNFSALNNAAIRDSQDFKADIIFMCNNDVEFLAADSLVKLVDFTRDQSNAGAVGCTLIYPDRRIQHLFVYVGSKIVGSHPHRGRPLNLQENWYRSPRPVPAVTGAVTLIRADVFQRVAGFDEELATSYQDVDLCLKVQELGLVNWVLSQVVVVHHETQTRGKEPNWAEARYIYKKWGRSITENSYVHKGLDRSSEHYVLRIGSSL